MFWNQIVTPKTTTESQDQQHFQKIEVVVPQIVYDDTVVDQEESVCENYSQVEELKTAEEQFYKDFNEIMCQDKDSSEEEYKSEMIPDMEKKDNKSSENEECFHVIIHELISAMSDLSKPMDHDVLNSLVDQLPKIKGVEYPTEEDCPDTCIRQSILLKVMTKLYEGVSRKCMETQCVPNDLYRDQLVLHEILASSCCEEEYAKENDEGCQVLDFLHSGK